MNLEARADNFFDRYAHDFNSIYGVKKGPISRILDHTFRKSMWLRYKRSIELCDPIIGKTVLDVGCGPGHYSVALAKKGAAKVTGVDFAEGMLHLAKDLARQNDVADRCEFLSKDILNFSPDAKFDYVIVMGVMDYIQDIEFFVRHVLSLTQRRAFFSFPKAKGILAEIRRYRYRSRCPLYLYEREQLESVFSLLAPGKFEIESLARDFFVRVDLS